MEEDNDTGEKVAEETEEVIDVDATPMKSPATRRTRSGARKGSGTAKTKVTGLATPKTAGSGKGKAKAKAVKEGTSLSIQLSCLLIEHCCLEPSQVAGQKRKAPDPAMSKEDVEAIIATLRPDCIQNPQTDAEKQLAHCWKVWEATKTVRSSFLHVLTPLSCTNVVVMSPSAIVARQAAQRCASASSRTPTMHAALSATPRRTAVTSAASTSSVSGV